ncbi:molybdopterin molybdotransferase MoeA [Sinomonas atrocyanea]|uniref:molybdopterin molybdotransferase MoeA n=1 Tax=Sinomonas atrocyanea TaxID=37927 RepID=UPI003D964628
MTGHTEPHARGRGGAHGHRTVQEHRARLAELLAPLAQRPAEERPLGAALGAALAADLVAPVSLPPFDNSQMDGFAVRSADFRGDVGATRGDVGATGGDVGATGGDVGGTGGDFGREFTVVAAIAAGDVPAPLGPGQAAPIMTGALLPEGADAVVPVERAVPSRFPGAGATVALPAVEPGTYVRRAGGDVAAGAVVLPAGTPIGARQIGLAAALGFTTLPLRAPLRVRVISTGAELAPDGEPLRPGQIYDANGWLLSSALREDGLEAENAVSRSDDPASLRHELAAAARAAEEGRLDLVITTGGVSKGAFEATKLALDGHDVEFSHLAMQPGGPQGLGSFEGLPVVAFPGNPVSCWISWEVLLRPVLAELVGAPRCRRRLTARLAAPLESPHGKLQVRRASLRQDGSVALVGGPGSHLLGALAVSDALVLVPEDVTDLAAGADVEVWLT